MTAEQVTGAAAVLRTLAAGGVRHVFTNPGTTEIAFVAAAPAVPEIEPVLVVDEIVASGAADATSRLTGVPGATLLHLGPGLTNAAANLHNATKAHSPVVNVVGDHASDHRASPSPLQSDIEAIAAPLSAWVGVVGSADEAAATTARAMHEASSRCGVSTLIVPSDHAEQPTARSSAMPDPVVRPRATDLAVDAAARALREPGTALLIGAGALRAEALRLADRLAVAHDLDLWTPTFVTRAERTVPLARPLQKLPYFPLQVHEVLGRYRTIVAIGTDEPYAMFAYPGEPRRLTPDTVEVIALVGPDGDAHDALARLVDASGAPDVTSNAATRPTAPDDLSLDPRTLTLAVAALLPDHAILVDESQTSGGGLWDALAGVPHDVLGLTGGAIGAGPPLATGAAFAARDRRVLNVQGDGSALYSAGAWWTQARHGLDVTTVIASNRKYFILDVELGRAGRRDLSGGPLTTLDHPAVDFVSLARGYGVPGVRVESAAELSSALARSFATEGPMLIDACW